MLNIQKIAKFAPVGTALHLILQNNEEIQGTVLEYDETTIILETENGIEGITGEQITQFKVQKETNGKKAPSTSPAQDVAAEPDSVHADMILIGKIESYNLIKKNGTIVECITKERFSFDLNFVTDDVLSLELQTNITGQDVSFKQMDSINAKSIEKLEPRNPLAQIRTVVPLHIFSEKDLERTKTDLLKIIANGRRTKFFAEAVVYLADLYDRENEVQKAIELYEKYPVAFRYVGMGHGGQREAKYYIKSGNYSRAIEILQAGKRYCTPDVLKSTIAIMMSYCYLAMQNYNEAINEAPPLDFIKKIQMVQNGFYKIKDIWDEFIEPDLSDFAKWELYSSTSEQIYWDYPELRLDNYTQINMALTELCKKEYDPQWALLAARRAVENLALAPKIYHELQWFFMETAEAKARRKDENTNVRRKDEKSNEIVRVYLREAMKLGKFSWRFGDFKKCWLLLAATYFLPKEYTLSSIFEIDTKKSSQPVTDIFMKLYSNPTYWNKFVRKSEILCKEMPWCKDSLKEIIVLCGGLLVWEPPHNTSPLLEKKVFDDCLSLDCLKDQQIDKIRELQNLCKLNTYDEKWPYIQLKNTLEEVCNYILQKDFIAKKIACYTTSKKIEWILRQCYYNPTQISFDNLRPALEHLYKLLKDDFEKICQRRPVFKLTNMLDCYSKSENGTIPLKLFLEVSNTYSPPVERVRLFVRSNSPKPLSAHSKSQTATFSIDTTDLWKNGKQEVEVNYKPSASDMAAKNISLDIGLMYVTRYYEEMAPSTFPISIRIGKISEEINNPYSLYSDGKPVAETDTQMFFGRNELVKEISQELNVKYSGCCYVLYGQKRSGKTSVLRKIGQNISKDTLYTLTSIQSVNYDSTKTLDCLVEDLREKVQEDLDDKFQLELPDIPLSLSPISQLRRISHFLQQHQLGWVVGLDEFTYIYANRKEDAERFMHAWKSIMEARIFNAILIGQDTMPAFRNEYPNDFCITNDKRITFLDKKSTIHMATEPIPNGKERFQGMSLEKVFQFTNGSPYYLQILCDEIVKYMNNKRLPAITGADMEIILDNMIEGEKVLKRSMFDSLVLAGDGSCKVSKDLLWKVLATIAKSNEKGECQLSDLTSIPGGEEAVRDLIDRGTLEFKSGRVKILVGLFTRWLRVNY